jgi:hypothetical protein
MVLLGMDYSVQFLRHWVDVLKEIAPVLHLDMEKINE